MGGVGDQLTEYTVSTYNKNVRSYLASAFSEVLAANSGPGGGVAFDKLLMKCTDFSRLTLGEIQSGFQESRVPLQLATVEGQDLRVLDVPFLLFGAHIDDPSLPMIVTGFEGHCLKAVNRDGKNILWAPSTAEAGKKSERWIVCVHAPESDQSDCEVRPGQPFIIETRDDFIEGSVRVQILEFASQASWVQSRVSDRNGLVAKGLDAEVRTSSSIGVSHADNPWANDLRQRICDLEQCRDTAIELIQLVKYGVGDFFGPHFDGGVPTLRRKTYLIYVNDDFEGGETRFGRIGQTLIPVAGRCISWDNTLPDGRIRWQAEHQGMPVTVGQKIALNIWVR